MKLSFQSLVLENFSYKVVSFLIALILCLTILGRRDFQVTKTLELDFNAGEAFVVSHQSVEAIKVRVAGSRNALRKYLDAGSGQILNLDVTALGMGTHKITIPFHKLDLPFGVKVISIRPETVELEIQQR